MAVMNGDEMCRQVMALSQASAGAGGGSLPCPVLIGVTGNAMSDDVGRFMASGAVCVLTKPVAGKVIVGEVRSRLAAACTLQVANGAYVSYDQGHSTRQLATAS